MTRRELVFVGKITRTHGVRGELKVREGLGCSGAWKNAKEVYLGSESEDASMYQVAQVRGGGKFVILGLVGVTSIEQAQQLKGQSLFVSLSLLPELKEDEFYAGDLIGMRVEDTSGRQLGVLEEIFDNGAHEVYVAKKGSAEVLIPVVDGVVVSVDRTAGLLVVELPDGLLGVYTN
ncbi:MAG: 16S rRNA processing protein RimM [Deltaproteobacteria bacterium]|nr:16S rRNA processing protein RimM [Deltaproteobacteria bacterium]MBW1871698.1 16S rRNA processing protein RimM [Deltaproteobacteria bacterium]